MAAPGHTARVAVVTDSTASLPPDVAERLGVRVVPLHVIVGDAVHEEATGISPGEVAQALTEQAVVSTSRPAPGVFAEAYAAAARAGATGVVSVHLSSQMSGTYDAAVVASETAPLRVRVVDSRCLGMGLGFAVVAAARAAAAGADVDTVFEVARDRAEATQVLFYVDTLEHLLRGWRIGTARALLGTALAVKPLLHLVDGRVEPLEKVRTSARALARLEELAVARAGSGPVDVAVQHLAAAHRAHELAGRLRRRVPGLEDVHVSEVGAAVGAHVGPGMLAVVVSPRPG